MGNNFWRLTDAAILNNRVTTHPNEGQKLQNIIEHERCGYLVIWTGFRFAHTTIPPGERASGSRDRLRRWAICVESTPTLTDLVCFGVSCKVSTEMGQSCLGNHLFSVGGPPESLFTYKLMIQLDERGCTREAQAVSSVEPSSYYALHRWSIHVIGSPR